jgi:hypothetical protein
MNIKITIDDKEVSLPQEVINQIKEACAKQKKGLWRPEENERYYSITRDGMIDKNSFAFYSGTTEQRIASGNCFQTEALAQAELDRRKALVVIKDYIAREFGEDKESEGEVEICWNLTEQKLECGYLGNTYAYSQSIPCLKTFNQANQLIKACEKELKIVLGV